MEEKKLINHIKQEMRVGEQQARKLLAGLHDALGYHHDMGEMYCSEINVKDYKDTIQNAHDALKILNAALGNLSETNRLLIDDYYREANNSDKTMIDLANAEMFETGVPKSGFYQISQRMQNALEKAEENIKAPGAGNARRDGKKYIAAIEALRQNFLDVFPDKKPSASPETLFYRYVQIWFQCFVDPENPDKDVRRHISNALNHKENKVKHVKGKK